MRRLSDRRLGARRAAALLTLAFSLAPGCDPGPGIAVGEAPLRDLPPEVSILLPRGAEVVYQEGTEADLNYHLWVVRASQGSRIEYPETLIGFEQHELPGSVLTNLLKSKAPSLAKGGIASKPCRYTHWDGSQGEFRVREAQTEDGWVAAVELFHASPGTAGSPELTPE